MEAAGGPMPKENEPKPDCIMTEKQCASILGHNPSYDSAILEQLVASFEGLSASCVLAASWLGILGKVTAIYFRKSNNDEIESGEIEPELALDSLSSRRPDEYDQHVLEALCLLLERRFDPDKLRVFMETSGDSNDGWRPPPFYWQLMRTPITARTLKQLCGKDRRSEFLLAFNEDLLAIESKTKRNWKLSMDRELGRITSNFTIFSRALAEVIYDFLLEDENEDLGTADPNHFSRLLCHTENSYLYSQAVLHFLPRWRPDLMGCRRLSQAIYRYVREVRCDHNVADVGLRFTGLGSFPKLHRTFIALQRQDPKNAFQQDDICAFSDAVTKVLSCFHRYQSLLYSRPRHLRTQRQEDFSSVPTPTASQPNEATYGNHDEPFFYPRHGGFGKRRTSLCVPQCDASLHKGGLPASRTIMYPSDALEQDLDSIAASASTSLVSRNKPFTEQDPESETSTSNVSFASEYDPNLTSGALGFVGLGSLAPSQLESYSVPLQDQLASACFASEPDVLEETGASDEKLLVFGKSTVKTVIQDVVMPTRCCGASRELDAELSIHLPPASQAGDVWEEEYDRVRYGPEVCPLHAIREGVFIDALMRDFISPSVVLSAVALPKTIELLLALTTLSPYEVLAQQDEMSQILDAQLPSKHRAPSHFRQLPGHWTTEGAYEREEDEESFLEDGVEEGEERSQYGWHSTPLDDAFNPSYAASRFDVSTPTIRIGLYEGVGAGKIGGRKYAWEQQPECFRKEPSFLSFLAHEKDGDAMDNVDGASTESSFSVPQSESSSVSKESAGSWTDTVWQKGISTLSDSLRYPRNDSEFINKSQASRMDQSEEWQNLETNAATKENTQSKENFSYYYSFASETEPFEKDDDMEPVTPASDDHAFSETFYLQRSEKESALLNFTTFRSSFSSNFSPPSLWNTSFQTPLQPRQGLLTSSRSALDSVGQPQFGEEPPLLYSLAPPSPAWIEQQNSLPGSPQTILPLNESDSCVTPKVRLYHANEPSYNPLHHQHQTRYSSPPSSPTSAPDDALFTPADLNSSEVSCPQEAVAHSKSSKRPYCGTSVSSSDFFEFCKRHRADSYSEKTVAYDYSDAKTNITKSACSIPATDYSGSSRTSSAFSFPPPCTSSSQALLSNQQQLINDPTRWETGTTLSTIADEIYAMQSVVGSEIFVDPLGQRTIGLPTDASARRQAAYTRKEFRSLHRRISTYEELGRRDLFEVYSIVRDPLLPSLDARIARLLRCTRSLVGASVTLSFLEHRVIFLDEDDTDPILTLTPAVLTAFIAICLRHPKKRIDVLSILHRCFQKSHEFFQRPIRHNRAADFVPLDHVILSFKEQQYRSFVDSGTTADCSKLQQSKRRVFNLLMWLLGMGLYAGVFTFLRFHMSHIDRSLLRKQMEHILECCKPPFSGSFVSALLHLLHELVFVQKPLNLADTINAGLRNLILASLDHTLQSWAPRQPPPEIVARTTEIRETLMPGCDKKPSCGRFDTHTPPSFSTICN